MGTVDNTERTGNEYVSCFYAFYTLTEYDWLTCLKCVERQPRCQVFSTMCSITGAATRVNQKRKVVTTYILSEKNDYF